MLRGVILALGAMLTAGSALAQSLVVGGVNTGASFYSGYRFNTHYANGYYWTTFKDGACAAGRLRVYSSADGSTWAQAAGSPAFTAFCPAEGEWAVRFLGNVIVAFAYNGTDTKRYYSKGTLNSNGSITWQKQDDATVAAAGAVDVKLNAAIVNGKPVLWQADAASAGRVSIGSSLDTPTWNTYVNPTALTAGLPNNGSNGQFSAGAVFPLFAANPNDFIIMRASSATGATAQGHRVITIKFHADTNTFDTIWYNASTLGNGNPTDLPEDVTTEVSLGTDDVVQSRFAAAQQPDGIIHVVYVNRNGNILHYRRGSSSVDELTQDAPAVNHPLWTQFFGEGTTLNPPSASELPVDDLGAPADGATAVDKVGLGVIDANNLYIFYSRVGSPATLYYRRFDGRGWGAQTTILPSVTLKNYSFGTMETATGCNAGVAWNEGTNPYSVYFRAVNTSCTAPTTYYRSIGTAADYGTGQAAGAGTKVSVTTSNIVNADTGSPLPAWLTANRGLGDVIVIPCDDPPACLNGANPTGVPYTIASVNTETRLTLTSAFAGTPGTYSYLIQRQFQSTSVNAAPALLDWENCIDGGISGTSCNYAAGGTRPTAHNFNPIATTGGNLVNGNRVEVGVLYKDSIIQPTPGGTPAGVSISGTETSALHRIVLMAAPGNRHNGYPAVASCTTNCASVVWDGGSLGNNGLRIVDSNLTVQWLEFRNFRGATAGMATSVAAVVVGNASGTSLTSTFPNGTTAAQNVLLSNLLIHDFDDPTDYASRNIPSSSPPDAYTWSGIRGHNDCCKSLTVRNTMVWDGDDKGIELDEAGETYLVENTTVDYMHGAGITDPKGIAAESSVVTVKNSISTSNSASNDFDTSSPGAFSSLSSNNISSTGTPPGANPQTVAPANLDSLYVTPASPGPGNLHLEAGSNVEVMKAVNAGLDLSSSFGGDVDGQARPAGAWDRGADERDAATAVTLTSFAATGVDSAVELSWQTSSELSNLGFHVYRAMLEAGPFARITSSLIAGLGSSPVGARYSYRDVGLVNGTVYYYKLEDVETTGRTKLHGPVWATPAAAVSTAPPAPAAEPAAGPARVTYGDPSKVGLRVMARGANGVVLELTTRGFFAEPLADGTVRLSVPGFETLSAPGLASLPVERAMLEARVGRKVRIASVQPFELLSFSALRPEDAGKPEMSVRRDGTVRPTRRRAGRRAWVGAYPESAARVVSVGFQGETKKALVELCPLRWDEGTDQLLLARRLRVEVVFTGREDQETGQGTRGRRAPRDKGSVAGVVARLSTQAAGLHAVSFEQVLAGRRRGVMASELSLHRLGTKVAFHVTPDPSRFAPGSRLYFVSVGPDANPEGNEAVYELSLGQPGLVMGETSVAPAGATLFESTAKKSFELNRYYLSSVTTPWLWEYLRWGERKSLSFNLTRVASSGAPGRIEIALQGVSDYPVSPDHHIRASLNGTFLGEVSWDGKLGQALEAEVPAGVLREGQNALELENLPDTAAGYSLVYLDRFTLRYPQALVAESGRFEGSFGVSGEASLAGLSAGALLLDTTGRTPVWLSGAVAGGGGLGFRAEAGHGYLAVSPEAVLAPEVRLAASSTLRAVSNQADYLLLAPRAFLTEAELLLEHRREQGLSARGVAIEEIFEEFGHGEAGPQAIRDFLAYAYHHWSAPSPRYVLLLGDASYDTKDYLGLHRQNLLPTPQVQTSYLWTASDPALASLNGEDGFPDIALGRLSASTAAEARVMIQKILAWESAGFTPLAGPATLVADNPDPVGDFESDAEEIASGWLGGREVERIYLSRLGMLNARSAVKGAFERGTSLMSYIGHGSTTLWASEQMLNPGQVDSLAPQAQQPLVLAMNCLNGYFITPWSDSLAEKLVKAEEKGAIAAFTSSGLSLNEAAKVYHKAMLDQILHGSHERLGDALLAAQSSYADSGADPEMLAIYHLFGDPALRIR